MKKTLPFATCLLLIACSGTVKPHPEVQHLLRVEDEPVGCRMLFRIDAEATVFTERDAITYLENQIVASERTGNVYWQTSMKAVKNEGRRWWNFAPTQRFIMQANVYSCPANFVTRADQARRDSIR